MIYLSYIVNLFSIENPKLKTWTVFRNVRFLPPAEFQRLGLEEKIEMSQSGQMAAPQWGRGVQQSSNSSGRFYIE